MSAKLRKPKPTLKEAEKFRKVGHYSVLEKDYIKFKERIEDISKSKNEIEKLIKRELPKVRRLDLVILKCHILLEYMLNQYIRFVGNNEYDISKDRFSFSNKIIIAHILGLPPDPTFIPSLEIINKLRNQVAHTMSLNRELIDTLIKINSDKEDIPKEIDDKFRAIAIREITKFYCGAFLGAIEGHNYVIFKQ